MQDIPTDPADLEAVVTFYPQQWVRDMASPSGDPVTFTVPVEDVLTEDGELMADDTYESDALKEHENAPEEVRENRGPFYFVIEELR